MQKQRQTATGVPLTLSSHSPQMHTAARAMNFLLVALELGIHRIGRLSEAGRSVSAIYIYNAITISW